MRTSYHLPLRLVLVAVLAVTALPSWAQERGGNSGKPAKEATAAESRDALLRELAAARRQAVVAEVEVERLRQRVLELEAELVATRQGGGGRGDALAALDPYDPLRRGGEAMPTELPSDGLSEPGGEAGGPTIEIEELDDPLEADTPAAGSPAAGSPAAGSPAAVSITNDKPPNAEALDLYDRGYALFHQQEYRQAEDLFADYIERFSETELADNALFWIGECRYGRQDFDGALDAFAETVVRFPAGNKVPDALLKAGKCLEALGRPAQARATYQELVERFPGTLASLNAEERLRGLDEG